MSPAPRTAEERDAMARELGYVDAADLIAKSQAALEAIRARSSR